MNHTKLAPKPTSATAAAFSTPLLDHRLQINPRPPSQGHLPRPVNPLRRAAAQLRHPAAHVGAQWVAALGRVHRVQHELPLIRPRMTTVLPPAPVDVRVGGPVSRCTRAFG